MIEPNYTDQWGQRWLTVQGLHGEPWVYDVPYSLDIVLWIEEAQRFLRPLVESATSGLNPGPSFLRRRPWTVTQTGEVILHCYLPTA